MMNDTRNVTDTPRAWVGCLACYNAGELVGAWVDGIEAADSIPGEDGGPEITARRSVWDAHFGEGHEEWWVFDHEGYGELLPGECSPANAQSAAQLIAEAGDPAAFIAYAGYVGAKYATVEAFEEAYAGVWDTFEDYAAELAEAIGLLAGASDELRAYFAYDRWARDLLLGGDYWTVPAPDGAVYVFRTV